MSNRFTELPKSEHAISFPEAARILTDEAVEISDSILRDNTAADMQQFCIDNTKPFETADGRRYQMVMHVPDDFNGNVLVVPAGMKSGIGPAPVVIAEITRQIADPHAALLVQANASFNTVVNNFSKEESHKLHKGDPSPVMERLIIGLKDLKDNFRAEHAIYSGASLGAKIASTALKMYNDMPLPAIASTVVEPVHVKDWSLPGMGAKYLWSSRDFKKVMDLVAPEGLTGDELLKKFQIDEGHLSIGALKENLALAGILRKNTLGSDLSQVPDHVGIVQASALKSKISPYAANMEVYDAMYVLQNYEYYTFENPNLGHDSVIVPGILGAFTLRSMQLHDGQVMRAAAS